MHNIPPPNGRCFCGCGRTTRYGKHFVHGHDKAAEAAFITLHYGGSVPAMLAAHGYGTDVATSVTGKAVSEGHWVECSVDGCGYRGRPGSVERHFERHRERND